VNVSNHEDARRAPLVVFPGALGDFICFLPALAAITRRSGATPVLLSKEELAPLVAASGIAEHVPLEGPRGAWLFSSEPPLEAERFFRSFSSIECFTGFGDPEVAANLRRWHGADARLHRFRSPMSRHLALHFLDAIGEPAERLPQARLPLRRSVARRILSGRFSDLNKRTLLVVHPGSGALSKRWSRTGFVRVALRWQREGGETRVVIGPAESTDAPFWRSHGLDAVEGLRIDELAVLLSSASVFLGNDSGVSHLAAAVGAHGVALFGPTDERLWRPLSEAARVIRPSPWTAMEEEAPSAHVDEILAALRERAIAATRLDKVGSAP